MIVKQSFLVALALAGLAFADAAQAAGQEARVETPVSTAIEALLGTRPLEIDGQAILADGLLREIYASEGYRTLWTDERHVRDLLETIRDAGNHGLNPEDYFLGELLDALERRRRDPTPGARAEVDVLLTASLFRYAYHRRVGKTRAAGLDPDVDFRHEAFSERPPGETLREILAAPSIRTFIEQAAPSGPVYRGVQRGLLEYRRIAANGGWPTTPSGPALRVGDDDPRVVAVRARLAATGDLAVEASLEPTVFDAALVRAVKAFQARHALVTDGIVGKNTLAAMNVTVAHRIDQLRASLERLRWVNREGARTLVVVNIAGFSTTFFRFGEPVWSTRAMVGTRYRQTPVFRGEITFIEFNPSWTLPPVIIRNDTLPAVRKDPDYLVARSIRVIDRDGRTVDPHSVDWSRFRTGVPFTLRQDPGPENALGRVKFVFPNPHFVFLHDTPSRELFEKPERAFSSGCIRIEDPLSLAELLLDDPGRYSRKALEAIVASETTRRVPVEPNIPIVILYATASVAADGRVLFHPDIYDRDRRVLEALDGPVVPDPPALPGG